MTSENAPPKKTNAWKYLIAMAAISVAAAVSLMTR